MENFGRYRAEHKIRSSDYKRGYWAAARQQHEFLNRRVKTRQTDTDNFVFQSDLSTHFSTYGMKHELITGVEYLHR